MATERPPADPAEVDALARTVDDLATAYAPAIVLFAAVELGVFDALDRPRTLTELARRLGATAAGTGRLCRALVGMGLVTLEGELVTASPSAREVLARGGRASRVDLLAHHQRQLMPPLLRLAEAVRTGEPQHRAWPFVKGEPAPAPYDELSRHPSEVRTLVGAMDHGSRGVGDALARALDLREARLLVDVGGGGGVVARELLRALPELTVRTFDVGAACAFARERSRADGLSARHVIEDGDARSPLPVIGADVVLLSAILADFPREERLLILANARRALRPGGRVVVSETLLDDDRQGPPKAALLSLLMLAAMRGDQLSGAELVRDLGDAGFVEARVIRGGPRDLAVATAPGA